MAVRAIAYTKLPDMMIESVDVPAGNLPANCSLISLPIRSISDDGGLFNMLSAVFLVEWKLSEDCFKCHYQGGQCKTDKTNKFHCTLPNYPPAPGHQENNLHVQVGGFDTAITSFVSFLLSLLLILLQAKGISNSTCPKSFSCGNITNLSFPLSLSSRPDCGIMFLSGCDAKPNPRIQLLPGGDWYYTKPNNSTVWLWDPKLHAMLRQRNCQAFKQKFLPSRLSFYFFHYAYASRLLQM
ncbi:hypothetical protein HAX54_026075 [Datura stramonium]|uniref:Wall-associated receptor kinase C-terminal domain-containing protein n=1 Tax=Datura stramonium TaxID=4076 RepID=A0ABS8S7L7_DATST|nr:hypothetical protein [Datura stramonium]